MIERPEIIMTHEFSEIPVTILVNGIDESGTPFTHLNLNDIIYPNHHIYLPIWNKHDNSGRIPCQHINDGVEILCTTNGNAYVTIGNDDSFVMKQGDIVVVNPFEPHELCGIIPYERICLTFMPGHFMKDTFADYKPVAGLINEKFAFDNRIPAEHPASAGIREILLSIVEAAKSKKDGWMLFVHGQIFSFYYQMLSHGLYHEIGQNQPIMSEFIRMIAQYLDTRSASETSCRSAADFCGYSESHFCRLFKKNFGVTFIDYMNYYRIQHARRIFDSSQSVPLIKVMEIVGYSNSSYFTKQFKKIIGVPPNEYLKKHSKKT